MKENAEVTIIPYCWFAVCKAFFGRYPNPYSSHVLTEDTVHREVNDGTLLSKKIFRKTATTATLPSWIRKIVNEPQVYLNFDRVIFYQLKTLFSMREEYTGTDTRGGYRWSVREAFDLVNEKPRSQEASDRLRDDRIPTELLRSEWNRDDAMHDHSIA